MDLSLTFLLFIIFSFLGWFMEEINAIIIEHKIPNRGFLIGPICPIYGVGALLIIFLLEKYTGDILALFVLSTLLGAILEYFTSYIMEKIFKVRWWDYSDQRYNVNGRICLSVSVIFGFLGVITVHFLKPFFESILLLIPHLALVIIATIIFIIFVVDFSISFNIISKINKLELVGARDATNEISAKVKNVIIKHSILTRRLINAFPLVKAKIRKNV